MTLKSVLLVAHAHHGEPSAEKWSCRGSCFAIVLCRPLLQVFEDALLQVPLLVPVERVVAGDVVVGREQEPARAPGQVHHDLAGPRLDAVHDGLDERARRKEGVARLEVHPAALAA